MVELASLLLVDPVDHHDKPATTMPPAVLLAFLSPIAVLSLVRGFGLGLALPRQRHGLLRGRAAPVSSVVCCV